MKIKKQPVSDTPATVAAKTTTPKEEAIQYIRSAIETLGMSIKGSEGTQEREAIANLGVVMMDLTRS